MKKGLIIKSMATGVLLYAAAGFFGVPYAIKHLLPQKVSESTQGGKFSVESVAFNPFTFHLRAGGIAFKTPRGGEFLAMKRFSLNLDPLDYLWKGEWVLKDIRLTGPDVSIRRDEAGRFNFAFLNPEGSEEEEKKGSEPLKLLIKRFVLQEGQLRYSDYAEGKAYALDVGPIGFSLESIDLRDLSAAEGKMRLYATINEGGFIDLSGKIDALSPLKIGGHVAFDSGKLYTPWRYFRDKFPIEVADGKAAFAFDYRFDSGDVNATELSNLVFDVNRLRLIPKGEKRNLLSLESLRLREGSVLPMRREFRAASLAVQGVSFSAERGAGGEIDWLHYLEEIQKAFPEDENETKEPWQYRVEKVSVDGAGGTWADRAPQEPYRLSVSNLRFESGAVSSDPQTAIGFDASAGAIAMERLGDGAAVAGIGAVNVEGVRIEREGRFARVDAVSILSPNVSLTRFKDGSLDLARYIAPSSRDQGTSGEAGWGYRLGTFALKEGSVRLRDEVPSRTVGVELSGVNLSVHDLRDNPRLPITYALEGHIGAKSTFAANGEVVRSVLSSRGTFKLSRIDAALADPYLEPHTYASLRRGELSIGGEYGYSGEKAQVKGRLSLQDWVLNDVRDNSVLLGWNRIGVTPFTYAYPDNRLKINQLAIEGLYTNALIDANKVLNYSTLAKKTAAPKGEKSQNAPNPFGLEIVKLLVRNSSATFSDLSLPLPFKTYIHDLEGSVMGISTVRDVTTFVKLRGGVDQYGLAKIDGSLNTAAPKKFTDMKVAFENLDLPHYTPYSLQFLGYHIAGGKLFLDLGYKIDQGALRGENNVIIRQIELGAEKEGGSPWPMRLVVALLEDSDGIIDIDLPVQGDVNNPDFKYGKVVWQVITNLFTKAVTAPFRLLGSLLGIEDDSLGSVDFEGGSAALLPPQREKLDKIVTLLHKRPKLSLEVYGGWDDIEDVYALKADKLVAQAQKRSKKLRIDALNAIPLSILEDLAEESLEKKALKALEKEHEEKYSEEAAYVRHYSAALIERLVPLQPLEKGELEALAARRAETVRGYLASSEGLARRLVVKAAEKAKALDSREIPVRLNVIVP